MRKSVDTSIFRRKSTLLILLTVLVLPLFLPLSFSAEADTTTPRVVLAELFTATWCGYCPYATNAINTLAEEYGTSALVVLQYHPSGSDPFGNADSDTRVDYYGITGYPTMVFDGTYRDVGGSESKAISYQTRIDSELQRPAEVAISLNGSVTDFTANVTALGLSQPTSVKVRFVVYEDNLEYSAPNGEDLFMFTVRSVLSEQTVTLTSGETTSISRQVQPQPGWDTMNLGLAVFVQRDDTKEVLQAATFPKLIDFKLSSSVTVKSGQADSTITYDALLKNRGALNDTYSLSLTKSLPSGWTADFCVDGLCYPDSTTLNVNSDSSKDITVNIITSQTTGTGTVTLTATSQTDPLKTESVLFTGRVGQIELQVDSSTISDNPLYGEWGNGDADLNPGETVSMNITLRNIGVIDTYDVMASISTDDPYISLTQTFAHFGDVAIGSTGTSQQEYAFSLSNWCPTPRQVTFNLVITDSQGGTCTDSFTVTVNEALRKAVYVYSTNAVEGINFATMLQLNGILTTVMPATSLQSANLSPFNVIIIGNDVLNINHQYLASLNKPILGIGQGGYNLFSSLNLSMTDSCVTRNYDGTGLVQGSAREVFNFPTQVPVPSNQTITVSSSSSSVQSPISQSTENVTSILTPVDYPDHSLVTIENNRFLLWGPYASASTYTDAGKTLFTNCLSYLITASYPVCANLSYRIGIPTTTKTGGYWYYPHSISLSSTPMEQGLTLPASIYGNQLYGAFSFGLGGDTTFNVMIDASSGENYVAYVDTDNDKDLTDERAYYSVSGREFDSMDPPTLNIQYNGLDYTYTVSPYYYVGRDALYYMTCCYYETTITLEGLQYKIRTADVHDGDSFFNNPATDYFIIDLNLDGIIDCTSSYSGEGFRWTNPFLITDQVYHVMDVSVSGDQVVLEKVQPAIPSQVSCYLTDYHVGSFTVSGQVSAPFGSVEGSYVDIIYASDAGDVVRSQAILDSSGRYLDTVALPAEGIWSVRASWKGNKDYQKATSAPFIAQAVNPPPETVANYDGAWHTEDFTILLTATDDSGVVAETYYKINDGPTMSIGSDGHPVITTEGATNTLEYWSVDNQAAEELPHKVLTGIKLDKTAPEGTIMINGGAASTESQTATLTLSATDPHSEVSAMRFSNDGSSWSSWQSYSTTTYWTLTSGDGTKTVYVQFRNGAGLNSTEYSDVITLEIPIVYYDLTVGVTGSGSTSPAAGIHTYEEGTAVTVTATASSGWIFDHWMLGSLNVGSANSYTAMMDADYTLTAVFVEDVHVPPVAFFTYSPLGEVVTFDASGSSDTDGTIVSYFWDFGDGNTGSGMTVTHTYTTQGNYTATLTVTDNDGATDTTTQTLTDVIPEFSTLIMLISLVTATLVVVMSRKETPKRKQDNPTLLKLMM